jgi:hypothetical protein
MGDVDNRTSKIHKKGFNREERVLDYCSSKRNVKRQGRTHLTDPFVAQAELFPLEGRILSCRSCV